MRVLQSDGDLTNFSCKRKLNLERRAAGRYLAVDMLSALPEDISRRTIGKYTLLGSLGAGGMADVYLAVAQGPANFEKLLVIKRLRRGLEDDKDYVSMFLDEARLAARLNHPNIVHTYEIGESGGEYFMVMEYLDGQTLRKVITAGDPLPAHLAVFIASEVLAALVFAHNAKDLDGKSLNVIHRDVSPQNIFVSYQGQVKLIDFGIAKDSARATATEAGVIKGKLSYMSPEQALGRQVDARTDLFAVGVVLHELLTGSKLFQAESPPSMVRRLVSDPIPHVRERVPTLDAEIDRIVAKALEKDAANRYADAAAMRADLVAWLGANRALGEELEQWMERCFAADRKEFTARVQKQMSALRTGGGHPALAVVPPTSSADQPTMVERSNPVVNSEVHTIKVAGVTLAQGTPESPVWMRGGFVASGVGVLGLVALGLVFGLGGRAGATDTNAATVAPPAGSASTQAASVAATKPMLRLRGSDTIGAQLAPALVEAYFKKKGYSNIKRESASDHTWHLEGTGSDGPHAIDIDHQGSATAFTGLASAECDVGMSSRRIKQEEIDALAKAGSANMRSLATEHVIALDGVAVIVNPNSKLHHLQRAQIHDLFTGKISDWKDVGAPAGSVNLYARDDHSGTYDTFKELVLSGDPLTASTKRFAESEKLSDAVASDTLGIGFVGLPSVRSAKAIGVGDKGTTPIFPSRFTVASEDYPLTRRLYLYTPEKPKVEATDFVSFVMSNEGQTVIGQQGFVDLAVTERPTQACTDCPPAYAAATRKATRLSVDFRFEYNSTDLDGRAQLDIDRVTTFLAAKPKAKLMLFGFSDATGGAGNTSLSLARAQSVKQELETHGVRVARVEGFGAAMPVASNETDVGRDRNRRVEAWITEE